MTQPGNFGRCITAIMDSALAFSGETVYYTSRKKGYTIPIQALRTEPGKDESGEEGKRLNANVVVWTLYASTLSEIPASGDTIKDAAENTYDVLPVSGVLTEYKDPFGLILKINSKKRDKWAV